MQRIVRTVVSTAFACTIACLLIACGGAAASGAGGASEGGEGGPGGGGAVDEQAAQAQKKCESEIEKAVLQPPDALEKVHVHACLIGARPEWSKCGKGVAREITLKIIVEKTGEVSSAFAVGEGADGPEASCVAEVVQGVKFPQFKASPQQTLKYPFKLGQ
jgi:hypothetical protein